MWPSANLASHWPHGSLSDLFKVWGWDGHQMEEEHPHEMFSATPQRVRGFAGAAATVIAVTNASVTGESALSVTYTVLGTLHASFPGRWLPSNSHRQEVDVGYEPGLSPEPKVSHDCLLAPNV